LDTESNTLTIATLNTHTIKKNFDLILNGISFGIVGVSGVLTIILISKFYDKQYLGIFNLVYSIYILVSQFTGAGIHFSVLRHISQFSHNEKKSKLVLVSGLMSVTLNALLCISVFYLTSNFFLVLFDSKNAAESIVLIIPGLFFFATNKVFLAYYNGAKKFKVLAAVNSVRGLLLIGTLLFFIYTKVNGAFLPLIISVSEAACFVGAALYTLYEKHFSASLDSELWGWCKTHFVFGYKSLLGSVFIDVNTRIDVMILGLYATDQIVGVYSYPSMITEGFLQLPILIRTMINPHLTIYFADTSNNAWMNFTNEWMKKTYLILIPLGVLVVLAYPLLIHVLALDIEYSKGILPLAILIAGCIAGAGYFPFLMIFNQTGHPYYQSALYFLIFASNLILNLMFVPYWGMTGSAIGTALSNIVYVFIFRAMVKRQLGVKF